jgi:hypothetical protein
MQVGPEPVDVVEPALLEPLVVVDADAVAPVTEVAVCAADTVVEPTPVTLPPAPPTPTGFSFAHPTRTSTQRDEPRAEAKT